MVRIVIKKFSEKTLLQNFPKDPYSDLTVLTQNDSLELGLAYLTLDSQFFQNIDPDTRQVDLSELDQPSLIKVLRSFYGDELVASSIEQLQNLYIIICHLRITTYIQHVHYLISSSLKTQKQDQTLIYLRNSIPFLEFCLVNDLKVQTLKKFHIAQNMSIFSKTQNYLQLHKISSKNMNELLQEFHQSKGSEAQQIICHILQNYLNRTKIKPIHYFQDEEIIDLKMVWESHHHRLPAAIQASCLIHQASGSMSNSLKPPELIDNQFQIEDTEMSEEKIIDRQIENLQNQSQAMSQIVEGLKAKIMVLKAKKMQSMKHLSDDDSLAKSSQSILFQVKKSHKKLKKNKVQDNQDPSSIGQISFTQKRNSQINIKQDYLLPRKM